jgi:hypothetical protein
MILLAALFLILFEAIPEALVLKGHKTVAGVIEFIYRAVVTIILFGWLMGLCFSHYGYSVYYTIGGYLLLRFALFDVIYNLIAGLPIFYIGCTKLSDKLWQKFFNWSHFPVVAFLGVLKFICLVIGFTFLMTWQFGIIKFVKQIIIQ